MTGKERINNVLQKKSGNTICWTTLIGPPTMIGMPEGVRDLSPLEFYRHVGCDIMLLGCSGLEGVRSPCQLVRTDVEEKSILNSDGSTSIITKSKWGVLNEIMQNGHPVKYPVETIKDLAVYKNIWLNSYYEESKTDAFEKNMRRGEALIGNDGIMVNAVAASPVQILLEYGCGVMNFYNLYQDHPVEIQELLDVMHACRKQEYEIMGRRSPMSCVVPMENTSTMMISPQLYEKLSLPQITDFVSIMHKHNKLAILHMCGHLKNLLPLFKDTGCDGINAVTPPPLGDTPFEDVLDCLGEDFIILGGLFNPFQEYNISKEILWEELEKTYTPRIRAANLLLWMGADGQHMPYERFVWVKEWFEKQR